MTEVPDEAWESDDCVYRTVVMPAALTERLAARAERRGLSVSELLTEYAEARPAPRRGVTGLRARPGRSIILMLVKEARGREEAL